MEVQHVATLSPAPPRVKQEIAGPLRAEIQRSGGSEFAQEAGFIPWPGGTSIVRSGRPPRMAGPRAGAGEAMPPLPSFNGQN